MNRHCWQGIGGREHNLSDSQLFEGELSMHVGRWAMAAAFPAALMFGRVDGVKQTERSVTQIEGQTDWNSYGGGPDGTRYSSLNQINRSNVTQLQVAWTFDSGEGPGGTQCQPLEIGGVFYAVTP